MLAWKCSGQMPMSALFIAAMRPSVTKISLWSETRGNDGVLSAMISALSKAGRN